MIKTLIAFFIAIGLFGGAIYYVNQQPKDRDIEITNSSVVEKPYQGNVKTNPSLKYVGNSPDECSMIRFTCKDGQEYFANEDGCGCQDVKVEIKNSTDPLIINLVLGQATVLNRNAIANLPDGDTLAIAEMINEPCTEVCIWSGQGIWFNWYHKGSTKPVKMPPYPITFPYILELIDTDYETYAKIKIQAKPGEPTLENNPKFSKIEEGIVWYILEDRFSKEDYQNHCTTYYKGSFDGCMPSSCSTKIVNGKSVTTCTDDCNSVCALDQSDQVGPIVQVREVSDGVAWYYQDQYVTDAMMKDHCTENYQGTFNSCASAQACIWNCPAVCLPGCLIPN